MRFRFVSVLLMGGLISAVGLIPSSSADAAKKRGYESGSQTRGYAIRRGGYSYSHADTINTYGGGSSKYGGASVYRDPMLDRQTPGGPFDHGFFFDSAMGMRGGNAPYMH
jgi:hypothetical protein